MSLPLRSSGRLALALLAAIGVSVFASPRPTPGQVVDLTQEWSAIHKLRFDFEDATNTVAELSKTVNVLQRRLDAMERFLIKLDAQAYSKSVPQDDSDLPDFRTNSANRKASAPIGTRQQNPKPSNQF